MGMPFRGTGTIGYVFRQGSEEPVDPYLVACGANAAGRWGANSETDSISRFLFC